MDWIRYLIHKTNDATIPPESSKLSGLETNEIAVSPIEDELEDHVRLPYRSDELDFIFERKRDAFWSRTLCPIIAGWAFYMARHVSPFRYWYSHHRRFAWIAGTSLVYNTARYTLDFNLKKENFYYTQLNPGLLRFELEFESQMRRRPTVEEVNNLYVNYFTADAMYRQELEADRVKLTAQWISGSYRSNDVRSYILLEHIVNDKTDLDELLLDDKFLAIKKLQFAVAQWAVLYWTMTILYLFGLSEERKWLVNAQTVEECESLQVPDDRRSREFQPDDIQPPKKLINKIIVKT